MTDKLDVLVIGAHPDDAEFAVGGTILRYKQAGKRVGILDLTRGERGSRGDVETRAAETARANAVMAIDLRANFELPDARVEATVALRERLAGFLREVRPDVVFTHWEDDLHPDHVACARAVTDAWYLSGLSKLFDDRAPARRPRRLYHFPGHRHVDAALVVDVEPVWKQKLALLRCYESQLEVPAPEEAGAHLLAGGDVLVRLKNRARYWGERVGYVYGEPLLCRGALPAGDLLLP
ncbi:MAG: bacillithiol biosynthesis deacetylase BshB1 [Planctomycetes bacterium]|nr:bacillithiol biosynthesis deacetylase BshB1 [Planctomycetota bacterium]